MLTVTFTSDFLRHPLMRKPERVAVLLALQLLWKPGEPMPSAERISQVTQLSDITVKRSLADIETYKFTLDVTQGEAVVKAEEAPQPAKPEKKVKTTESKTTRFVPPTVEEVAGYLREKNITDVDAESFVAFYESKGWMVGSNKMKKWKSAITTWRNRKQNGNHGNTTPRYGSSASGYDLSREQARRLNLAAEVASDVSGCGSGDLFAGIPDIGTCQISLDLGTPDRAGGW